MATPGWYPDTSMTGTQRYWDGVRWTEHVAPLAGAPTVPAPVRPPRRRADGSVAGPPLWASLTVVAGGIALIVVALALVIPAFVDAISGPRWEVPGSHRVTLEEGPWMLYERDDFGLVIRPQTVMVTGPESVETRADSSFTETISINGRDYVGVVRFDIDRPGTYDITVRGESSFGTEVLLARPFSSIGSYWPWFLAIGAGGLLIVIGTVMTIVGAVNRGRAKRYAAAS
ncbi:DUF2510 domain-containing protein [Actinospongicola halichondriae]|uniref:DUF2510 domain-containing protein n=1 Tax=Actinospongicola halichondriae TaxID=3236844 RepID=UPI003D4FBF18